MYRRYRRRARRIYRRKRAVRRRRVPRRQRDNGIRFFKIKYFIPVTASSQTIVTDKPDEPATPTWTNVSGLFGYYRTNAIKVRFVPTHNSFPVNLTQTMNAGIFWHDWNFTPTTITREALFTTETSRIFDASKIYTYYRKCIRRQPINGGAMTNGWTNVENAVQLQRIILDLPPNVSGHIYITKYIAVKQRSV